MVILVSTAGFCCGYYTGSNSLSQHLLGVCVISSPALLHGQDPWGQHRPSPCSEVWERSVRDVCVSGCNLCYLQRTFGRRGKIFSSAKHTSCN